MGYTRYTHATISRTRPSALGQCDRCGFDYQHNTLSWQWDWAGPRLQNKRILVCPTCLDKPQEQLRSIVLPADPLPIMNSRQDPYMYMGQSSAISPISNSSENVVPVYSFIDRGYNGYSPTTALTFSSASAVAVSFANGNLTVINTGTTTTNQGAKVAFAQGGGLVYFEGHLASLNGSGGSNLKFGVDIDSDPFTSSNGTMVDQTGAIWSQGTRSAYSIGSLQQGDFIGLAVDAINSMAWFRKTPGGYWNGSVTADPTQGVGGVAVSTMASIEPFVTFGGANGTVNNAWSVNTNAALFTGVIPVGYVAWSAVHNPSIYSLDFEFSFNSMYLPLV